MSSKRRADFSSQSLSHFVNSAYDKYHRPPVPLIAEMAVRTARTGCQNDRGKSLSFPAAEKAQGWIVARSRTRDGRAGGAAIVAGLTDPRNGVTILIIHPGKPTKGGWIAGLRKSRRGESPTSDRRCSADGRSGRRGRLQADGCSDLGS